MHLIIIPSTTRSDWEWTLVCNLICVHLLSIFYISMKWARTWQNQQNDHPMWTESSLSAWSSYLLSAQWRPWSDWADAQADLSLCCAHRSFCWFCHAADHLITFLKKFSSTVFRGISCLKFQIIKNVPKKDKQLFQRTFPLWNLILLRTESFRLNSLVRPFSPYNVTLTSALVVAPTRSPVRT